MTSADVIRAHAVGILIEADARQPRQRGTVAPVAGANFTSMRKQMEDANRSIAVDLGYQTQRAASAEKRAALAEKRADRRASEVAVLRIFAGVLAALVIALAVTLWGMTR